jgi:hypothetical protein
MVPRRRRIGAAPLLFPSHTHKKKTLSPHPPTTADVKDEAALPFGLVLCPLGEGGREAGDGGGDNTDTHPHPHHHLLPTRGADVGRCSACFAYAAGACTWGASAWGCALCGHANAYLSASGARYALPASRAACPELGAGGVVDLPDDDEGGGEEAMEGSGGGGLPATLVVGLVDLGNSHAAPAVAECARSALGAVAAALPPGARLGVAAVSSQLTLFDPRVAEDDAASARVVSLLDGEAGPPAPLEIGDALPAPSFLAPLPRCAGGAAAALDALVAEATHAAGGGSAVGAAVQALLAYLAAGAGELAAAGAGCGSDGEEEGGGAEPATTTLPPPASRPPPLLGTRLMLFLGGPPNAGRGSISLSHFLDRPLAFWAAAGQAAAALGVVVDVFLLDGTGAGAAGLAPFAATTGGLLRVFTPDGLGGIGEDARLAGLARRLVSPGARTALAGEVRVRSSPGLRVARAYAGMAGGPAAAADTLILPRLSPGEAVAFDLEHARGRAGRCLDPAAPLAAQSAFRYWRLEGVGTNSGAPFRPRRRLRIITASFPSRPTPDPAAVHAGAAPAPILTLLAHKVARAAAAEGGPAAQGLLRDWLVLLTAARAHVDGPADPEAVADARLRGGGVGCEEGGLHSHALRALPRLVHGLHRSRLLGGASDPDGAALDAARLGWLPPLDLARALYPELTAWEGPEVVVRPPGGGEEGEGEPAGLLLEGGPRPRDAALPPPLLLPLTAASLACGPPLYCLDAHDAVVVVCVEGGGEPFPPPRGSALRSAVDGARARRPGVAPAVAFVSGADAAATALAPFLVDDVGEDGGPAPGGGGLAAFLAGVTEDARALLRDGAGV